ncbi:MAG: sugar ABC transporter permease, partial [Candidatus Electrothrix sp. AR1]|nr:sugar ABC transporter permease [Candidatus Electrothrix sp. AR1]
FVVEMRADLCLGVKHGVGAGNGFQGFCQFRCLNRQRLEQELVSVWQGAGFQMIVYLAGLQDISEELYEAARLDGANSWQQFRYVTFPCLRNTTLFVLSVTTILSFRLFDQVQIMTKGGPLNATTTVVFEAVRSAFERQQIARGSAMTVVFFIIVLCLTIFQRRLVREDRRVG